MTPCPPPAKALSIVHFRRGCRARACVVSVVVVVVIVVVAIVIGIVATVVIDVVVVVVVAEVVVLAGRTSVSTRRLSPRHQDCLESQWLSGVAPHRVVAQTVLSPVSKLRPRVRSGAVMCSTSSSLGRSVGILL